MTAPSNGSKGRVQVSNEIICAECPAVYRADQIKAFVGEEEVTTLAGIQPNGAAVKPSRSGRFLRAALGGGPKAPAKSQPNLEGLGRFRNFVFFCPEGHEVDGNAGTQFGIAVLGASGASKSHWLPAIVREMLDMSALRKAGVTLKDALYQNPQLTRNVREVFRKGRRLPPTPSGRMLGPYGYKLTARSLDDSSTEEQYSMLLYDIAGEDLSGITRIVEQARFIILSKALVVLIDPVDFLPTQFDVGPDNARTRLDAARDVRGGIQVIADTLAGVWEVPSSRDLNIPICFALAKADAIEWTGGFDWTGQTQAVVSAAAGGGSLHEALMTSSSETREAFIDLGGELVVDEIEDCFRADTVRYVAASATSTMPIEHPEPGEREWMEDPEPNGVALSVLQVLDGAGVLAEPVAVSA